MTNPFDDSDARFLVLRNEEGAYSLRPDGPAVPDSRRPTYGPGTREAALAHVKGHWRTLGRPRTAAAGPDGTPRC